MEGVRSLQNVRRFVNCLLSSGGFWGDGEILAFSIIWQPSLATSNKHSI